MAQNPDDFHKLLGRALTDEQFRNTLQKNPEAALKEAGIEPTPDKIAALKSARDSITKAHKAFGGGGMARPS
jgi:hypothetical protein